MRTSSDIAARAEEVRGRIAAAAVRAGRSPSGITLVAVSKTVPDAAVREAHDAGLLDFGESRAQALRDRLQAAPPLRVRWHFVGRLQRNKVDAVVGSATLIHSVDRMRLATAVAERAAATARVQRVLVQVNVSADPAKGGFAIDEVGPAVARMREMPGISVQGLMTVPALDADPAAAFSRMRALRDELRGRFPEVLHLSMGMSGDYELAVEQGATIVRVGTAIFGPRT
jgi:pyridoxal phosphate enzyme (YggS family)